MCLFEKILQNIICRIPRNKIHLYSLPQLWNLHLQIGLFIKSQSPLLTLVEKATFIRKSYLNYRLYLYRKQKNLIHQFWRI